MTLHRQWLLDQVVKNGWKTGVELGVKSGEMLDLLCSRCADLYIIGVDIWAPSSGYDDWDHNANHQYARAVANQYGPRCVLWRMDTAKAARFVKDGSLDFVFIDGDHSTQGVIRDIEAWRSKVKPGGWLCGDDAGKESVRAALDQVVPGWNQDGRCWHP